MSLSKIQEVVKVELEQFESFFKKQLQSPDPTLSAITNHIYRRKGKQLRPLLVFLAAKLHGTPTPKTFVGAAGAELLHVASLMHDDVVDEAYERRGVPSVQALWRSKVAVLAGDFILSRGLLVALENNATDLLTVISNAVKDMSEGELLQMRKAQRMDTQETLYFDVIRKKTASFFKSCTQIGALSTNASAEDVERIGQFGELMGIAFQLRDDILDFHTTGLTGKATGNDIKEKKITLPLIYALNQVSEKEQRKVLHWVAKARTNHNNIEKIIKFVESNNGFIYAEQTMQKYLSDAQNILLKYNESDARTALLDLLHYLASRKK